MSDAALAWLRAQLDDDERLAREAGPGPWLAITTNDFTGGPDSALDLGGPQGRVVLAGWFDDDPLRPTEAEHIARWDPARVLAEIEAKRRILDDYDIVVSAIRRVDDVEGNQLLYARRDARMSDIRWLAQPYADRPGFPQEWR